LKVLREEREVRDLFKDGREKASYRAASKKILNFRRAVQLRTEREMLSRFPHWIRTRDRKPARAGLVWGWGIGGPVVVQYRKKDGFRWFGPGG